MKKTILVNFMVIVVALIGKSCYAQNPGDIKLKNYRPVSIYKIPVTKIEKAKFPVIDMHSHQYAPSKDGLAEWIKIMDKVGVEKTIILTEAAGSAFDSIYAVYSRYPERFEIWCNFDYTGYNRVGPKGP